MRSSVIAKYFIICTIALSLFCGIVVAQSQSEKPKAAVYIKGNPQGRDVLMMAVNTFLVKTGRYQMIAVDAIDLLAQEHIRQQSGSVSDNEIAKLGRDAGAQYVCVVERTEIGGVSYVTTSMVSVQSKIAEFSDMKELPRGERVINVIERQINAMLGISSGEEQIEYEPSPEFTYESSPEPTYELARQQRPPSPPASLSPSPAPSSRSSMSRFDEAKAFDADCGYISTTFSTIYSRDYGIIDARRNSLFMRYGGEGFSSKNTKTRNIFGMGLSGGFGYIEGGILGFVVGIDVKDLFWLVKRHVAIPITLGFDYGALFTTIEKQTAANFIDVMSAADKVSDSTLTMYMHKLDVAPAIGLQIFTSPKMSIYIGYVYNVNIPIRWSIYYKIPGKYYSSDDNGELFKVPKEYAPLQDLKGHFLGVPGTLRLDLKFHGNK
jgi:hypothetical protein